MAQGNTAPLARWDVDSSVWSVAVSHDNTRLAAGSSDGYVRVWDVRTGALVLGPLKGHTGTIFSVAFSHDSTIIISGSKDRTIRIWDTRTGAPVGEPLKGHTGEVNSVAFSHDSTHIISGSDDTTIRIWDARTGAPIGEPFKGNNSIVRSVAFSHDSTHIVSGSQDATVRIWNARTGAPIGKPLVGHTSIVMSVRFSHDSTRIISGSADKTIGIWDAHTGSPVGEPLKGHTDWIRSVAFSHDSTRIISGSDDMSIHVWDARTGTPIGEPLKGHTSNVLSVALSHDNTRIFSGSDDGTIREWQAPQISPAFDIQAGKSFPQIDSPITFVDHEASVITNSEQSAPLAHPDDTPAFEDAPQDVAQDTPQDAAQDVAQDEAQDVTQDIPSFDMVSSSMSAQEMFEVLVKHGCIDLTSSMDANRRASEVIASGGFGDIRRVALDDGTFVALKTLRLHVLRTGGDKGVKRAVREVYLWSRLRHSHIQELLGIIVFQGGLGMVSPWRKYGHLQDYITAHPGVARHPLCVQLASAVSYLHGIEMVHGDLKSVNVLVADEGTLKISDFDYAILSDTTLQFTATTRPGGGTLRWMAPELFQLYDSDDDEDEGGGQGEPKAEPMRTKQTDVYALGMTMLEIVTGTIPYSEYRSEGRVITAIQTKKPPRRPKELTGTDEEAKRMWNLLLQCWHPDPSTRPDASSVMASLQSFAL